MRGGRREWETGGDDRDRGKGGGGDGRRGGEVRGGRRNFGEEQDYEE